MTIGKAAAELNPDCHACASCAACDGDCGQCPYWDYSKHGHDHDIVNSNSHLTEKAMTNQIILTDVKADDVPFGEQFFWLNDNEYLESSFCKPGDGGEHTVYIQHRGQDIVNNDSHEGKE